MKLTFQISSVKAKDSDEYACEVAATEEEENVREVVTVSVFPREDEEKAFKVITGNLTEVNESKQNFSFLKEDQENSKLHFLSTSGNSEFHVYTLSFFVIFLNLYLIC